MSALFVDLYRYRQREKKNNLEDWLTECLAGILRSLTAEQFAEFVSELVGQDLKIVASEVNGLNIRTQVHAGEYGRPDLVIEADGQPVIVFENKVAHSVGTAGEEESKGKNQLERYADWLSQSSYAGRLERSLVFLSHITLPPENFGVHGSPDDYDHHNMVKTTWGRSCRLLQQIVLTTDDRNHSKALVTAFHSMLKEHNMTTEFPSMAAIAAAEVFLNLGGQIQNMVGQMWERVCIAANCGNQSGMEFENGFESGIYSAFRFMNKTKRDPDGWTFLQTGIWYPGFDNGWSEEEIGIQKSGPHAFIYVGNEQRSKLFDDVDHDLPGWLRPDSNFLCLLALSELSRDPDERGSEILAWCEARAHELRGCLVQHGVTAF